MNGMFSIKYVSKKRFLIQKKKKKINIFVCVCSKGKPERDNERDNERDREMLYSVTVCYAFY